MAIDKGSYVRKKNFDFFKNFYLDGTPEFVPAIYIVTIKSCHEGKVTINGEAYPLESLVEVTEAEANALCREYSEMKLSEASLDDVTNAHIRRDTGEVKKAQTYGHALRHVFSYNKKNPDAKLQAYKCPECGEIHCGRAPRTLVDFVKMTPHELLAEVGEAKAIEITAKINKMMACQRHAFSKAMNQPSPRLCAYCNSPEDAINAVANS